MDKQINYTADYSAAYKALDAFLNWVPAPYWADEEGEPQPLDPREATPEGVDATEWAAGIKDRWADWCEHPYPAGERG